jgi:uncharacterized protein YndB with AHSA1/START domain
MTTQTQTKSVTTEIDVEARLEHAFAVFTDGIGTWWNPSHHLLDGELTKMVFDPHVGGSITDHYADGRECRWSRVLAYEPPTRVVFSWDINLRWQLETDLTKTSEVEVAFTALDPGRTHVVLTHRHLDRHGDGWPSMRDAVASGWSLDAYADAVKP